MAEFLYVYRMEAGAARVPPEQMQKRMESWMAWMKDLDKHGHLKDAGHPLEDAGKVVKADKSIHDGPFAETKDLIGGFSLIIAKDLSQAAELAKGCPVVVGGGGTVEVRPLRPM